MNKLDRYDARKLEEMLVILRQIENYNYVPSSRLSKKLETIDNKLVHLLETELEPKLQAEYNQVGRV